MQEIDANDIRLAAMNLLARREHLRGELEVKLGKRFGAGADIGPVLDQLAEESLLSDQRFAESYIHYRSRKGYGPNRIRQELRQKGACSSLVSLALEACDTDWVGMAREVRRKKFGESTPADFREKSRQLRFLQYRGFTGEFAALAFTDP